MQTILPQFKLDLRPIAAPNAVVVEGRARFSILSPRVIRLEYDPRGSFEDRASQAVWYREQLVPPFSQQMGAEGLHLETDALRLEYHGGIFSAENLSIQLKTNGVTWHYGDADPGNLGGTGRTLDGADGPIPLEKGLISRDGWSVLDDSHSLVFDARCWLGSRQAPADALDLYFFGYGQDYAGCLQEYTRIAGKVPMIPRWALGNWWSRYWEYTQDELTGLMDDFQAHQVPLGVCIIDMDWHITQTGNQSTGWTGYTWNRQLFPNPPQLLADLHQQGLRVALNLHPAEGVHPHEEMYPQMAEQMGVDPTGQQPVEFDIANPQFVQAYFELLHHPQEEQGIDFWWMDWQQGTQSRVEGLDPLWWLNHLHFYDLGRGGKKRSFVFSRWGGYGNQRYPIGFSGDTVVSWPSLAFQPYFTATAANVDYGWWSHDIGGHMRGIEDGELYARWVQFGAFSPILRLHSTKNMFQERRPWGYDAEVFRVARDAMQFRHALVPYLYSMGWRYRCQAIPPITPMYYADPAREEAYACPNQYQFGDQLIAAPFVSPREEDTRLSRQAVWLPDGGGFNFWNGEYHPAGWQSIYGRLDEMPLFARPGAIVPLGPKPVWNGLDNPTTMKVYVFGGADGTFNLYEDDGDSNAYLQGAYRLIPLRQSWTGERQILTIGPASGDATISPAQRSFQLFFRGSRAPAAVQVRKNDVDLAVGWGYDATRWTVELEALDLAANDRLEVVLVPQDGGLLADGDSRKARCQRMLAEFRLPSGVKESLYYALDSLVSDPKTLLGFRVFLHDSQARALLETLLQAGAARIDSSGEKLLVAWNQAERPEVRRALSAAGLTVHWWQDAGRVVADGVQPRFSVYRPGKEFASGQWFFDLDLAGLVNERFGS